MHQAALDYSETVEVKLTVQSPNFVNTRFAVTVQESAITPIAGALYILEYRLSAQ